MASSAQPPPKKRKFVEAQTPGHSNQPAAPTLSQGPPRTPQPPQTLAVAVPASLPPPQLASPSLEDVLCKRRNQEELRNLFECYRWIRRCVESKDTRLMRDVDQVYLSLITASRGCASVQCILAKMIPQYASYCPTALEAAAKVSINMYKWNLAIVIRGEDVDGVAYKTTRACIIGLVDICSTASSEAPKSSVITGICSAVYMTVLSFFISTFDGKDIYHIGSLSKLQDPVELLNILKQEPGDDNQLACDCLFELRALSLLCIFLLFPENLLESCFALIASAETDNAKREGLYFLNQLTCHLNSRIGNNALGDKTDGASQCTGGELDLSSTNELVGSKPSSDITGVSGNSVVESNQCYITMAISKHPSLRGWILRRYKKFCDSCKSDVVPEVSSCLKVLGYLSELDEDKSHMDRKSSILEKLGKSGEQKIDNIDRHGGKYVRNTSVQTMYINNVETEKLSDAKIKSCKGRTVVKGAKPDLYGASVSSDVISVSKELWVGSMGNGAAEALVRSKFEEFGPLANFLFYPSKDFSLVEYGNIMHAIQACGYMQGSSIWGGGLQIRYLDRFIGNKGFIGGIAIGDSCHIYVARVMNQKDKNEMLDGLKAAGLKMPCSFTDIRSENALLLKFETAIDATAAKAYIRRQAHSDFCSQEQNTSGHQLFVQNMDKLVPDTEFIKAFSRFGEIGNWEFNRVDGNCLIDYKSHNDAASAKSHLHGARFGLKLISVESRTCSAGSVRGKTSSPLIPKLGHSGSDSISHHGISHVSPRMMPGSNFRINSGAPLPFIPSSITPPLGQLPVGSAQPLEEMAPHIPNTAPPSYTPRDIPLSPHLPISQPPSVPPAPTSLLLRPATDPFSSQKSSSHPRWQGPLSKSGLQYCTIYASRIELDACRYEHAVEPSEWPSRLDVTMRTNFQHVKTTFFNTPSSKKEVCRLLPCSNGDRKGFRDFVSYLKQKERAGVIKIPGVKPMWTRELFILPPTSNVFGMLNLPPHPSECLIALVLAKETTSEAS